MKVAGLLSYAFWLPLPSLPLEFLQLTLDATLKTLVRCVAQPCVLLGLVGGVLSSEVWWQSARKTKAKPKAKLFTIHFSLFLLLAVRVVLQSLEPFMN